MFVYRPGLTRLCLFGIKLTMAYKAKYTHLVASKETHDQHDNEVKQAYSSLIFQFLAYEPSTRLTN